MAQKYEVKKGDIVRVIIEVWNEAETPAVCNFYTGKIVEVVERTESRESDCYVRIANLDGLIPVDRTKSV